MEDYITILELADFMDVDELFQTSADLVIAASQQAVRKYMGQEITLHVDDVETHDGRGRRHIRLRERPVRDLTSVFVDDVELDPDSYSLRGARLTYVNSIWAYGVDNIEVTYTHGWDTELDSYDVYDEDLELVPADIKLVTLSAARRFYIEMGPTATEGRKQSETIGKYSYTLEDRAAGGSTPVIDLLPAESAVLDRYVVRLTT